MSQIGTTTARAFTSPNFNKGLLTIAQNRLRSKSPQITRELRHYLFSRIRYEITNHPVIKSLAGAYAGSEDGTDLPAEYGLDPNAADEGIALIEEKTTDPNNIKIQTGFGGTRTNSALINISAEWLPKNYIQDIIFDSRGYYVSEKSGQTIPWAYWMLSEFGEPVTSEDFGILYTDKVYDTSRSGRAFMVDKVIAMTKRNGFPYEAPAILVSYNGKNWIENAIGSVEFENEIKNELKSIIRKNIASISRIK
jgi:hypothetical protein